MFAYDDMADRWRTPEELLAKEAELLKEIESIDFDGSESYNRTAGEIEARDVQARANMTPEQLAATAPYSSENIAPETAIVMFQKGASKKGSVEFLADGTAARIPLFPRRFLDLCVRAAREGRAARRQGLTPRAREANELGGGEG
jgi:hypothetical protein